MRNKLKHVLVDHPEPAWMVAKSMNKSDAWISKVTRGMINPNAKDKKRLAKILGRPVNELFTSRTKGQK
jgi:transcriptional regulator with XRE-family HTH domain